ncbi:hypothetical protein [Methanimicrococcus hongohii]|uniref:hypothetical protein n=1 Tax=Methanimicrococcus hongohii TaxID=3028295 RepID=UPI002930C671|nr:hypothetical protein [Methanimicrococcus sp. Hf6]
MKRSFKFLIEAKKRDLADSFHTKQKNKKQSNLLISLSAPAEPAGLQLSLKLLLPIRFALLPASALFLVIRSHSRTCRCYPQVSVSAASNQVSAAAARQLPPREPHRFYDF